MRAGGGRSRIGPAQRSRVTGFAPAGSAEPGHSTFSRAAATVLAELTGSPYFPSGLGTFSSTPGYLYFEQGPSAPVTLTRCPDLTRMG